jgi:hypothetical protein
MHIGVFISICIIYFIFIYLNFICIYW